MTHVLEHNKATILDLITSIHSEFENHAALNSADACLAFGEVLRLLAEAAEFRSVAIACRSTGVNLVVALDREAASNDRMEEARQIACGDRPPSYKMGGTSRLPQIKISHG